jgi:hypothetical protein
VGSEVGFPWLFTGFDGNCQAVIGINRDSLLKTDSTSLTIGGIK